MANPSIVDRLYLAVALLKECNLSCGYCHPFGESKISHGQNMSQEEAIGVINAAYRAGFRVFRLTGGECTLLPWFGTFVRHVLSLDGTRINVCTNGTTLSQHRDLFNANKTRLSLRVSLDSLIEQSRRTGLAKVLTPSLDRNLRELSQDGVNTRLNVVVTRQNVNEVPKLIAYCAELGFDVKLLDLYVQEQYIATNGKGSHPPDPMSYWKENYVPLSSLIPTLLNLGNGTRKEYNRDGGFGIPMYAFEFGGVEVILKDSTNGAHFSRSKCVEACPRYMVNCQEGVYTPHVSSNMTLHINGCGNKHYQWQLRKKTIPEQVRCFQAILDTFFTDLVHVGVPLQPIRHLCEQHLDALVDIRLVGE